MIPFSLASGKLKTADQTGCKFSVLELSTKGFLFRVMDSVSLNAVKEIRLTLRLPFCEKQKNFSRSLSEWILEKRTADGYFQVVYAAVHDAEYAEAVRQFSEAYLEYIDAKLNLEEAELAQKYTGYPAEKEKIFSHDFTQWKKKMFTAVPCEGETGDQWLAMVNRVPERMICVNTRSRCSRFLTMNFPDFLKTYWNETGLEGRAISRMQVNGVVFGSETCRHLMPDFEQLKRLTCKAKKAGLKSVIAFSPMKATETEDRRLLLQQLNCADPSERPDEIVINDFGMAELVNQLPDKPFRLRLGILMNKHAKDPRQNFRTKETEPEQNLLNAPFYLEYLKEQFNISAFSAEAWHGCALPTGDTALNLPYIQTNTGGHCPLRALCLTGDRGNPGDAEYCHGFCENTAILYPDFLKTVEIQNSVYALNTAVLERAEELNEAVGERTTRLVFNFF